MLRSKLRHVTTLAGAGHKTLVDGMGTLFVKRFQPVGVAIDGFGNIIVGDGGNHVIPVIDRKGKMRLLAGRTEGGDGRRTTVTFRYPSGFAVDEAGNVIVVDKGNHCIRMIATNGTVRLIAGSGVAGFADGKGSNAQFHYPHRVAMDHQQNIIVADSNNHQIRRISPAGKVTVVAGTGLAGHVDGPASAAQFHYPKDVVVDDEGNIIVADQENHRIRMIASNGQVSLVAGSDEGCADGIGSEAKFRFSGGLALDKEGNIIVADTYNHQIRMICRNGPGMEAAMRSVPALKYFPPGLLPMIIQYLPPYGSVISIAGCGEEGLVDGDAAEAKFNLPSAVAVGSGGIVVCDHASVRLIK